MLIIISSFILLLPVAIGLLQILCNKSGGVSYFLLNDNSIQDYYKIAEVKAANSGSNKIGDRTEAFDKL